MPKPGTTTQRQYGSTHQREREQWVKRVATGAVACRRTGYDCLKPEQPIIQPNETWHLGHPDETCPNPKAPEHEICNLSAAGKTTARRKSMTIREW